MSGRAASIAAAIEAAYVVGGSDEAWLRNLCEAAVPMLDRGSGIVGATFDVTGGAGVRFVDAVASGATSDVLDAFWRMSLDYGPVEAEIMRRTLQASTTSQAMGPAFDQYPLLRRHAHPLGVRDMIGVGGCDVSGQGVLITVPLRDPTALSRREQHVLIRLAAHYVAAFRLRRAVARACADRGQVEAVLRPSGAIEHAENVLSGSRPLRALLQRAVVEIDKVRARSARVGDETVVDVWSGLVAGRWSLVDLFESDGKRYVVARRNDPAVMGPERFTERERQILYYLGAGHSNKCIAYELGLAYSTVTTILSRLRRRLGLRSAGQLTAIGRELFDTAGAAPSPAQE